MAHDGHRVARTALGGLVLLFLASVAFGADSAGDAIVGVWLTEEGEGKIKIYRCGEKYCGKTLWIRPTVEWPDPSKKTDVHNPDPKKRARKMIGATILWGLTFDGEDAVYGGGSIYDNSKGKVYPCKAWVQSGGKTLKLRGFVGISLLGRNTYWSRVK